MVNVPLAERMRPQKLDDFVGQKHIVGKNMLLNRAISMGEIGSCIFYGPPGTENNISKYHFQYIKWEL